jgi:hypothetical protein
MHQDQAQFGPWSSSSFSNQRGESPVARLSWQIRSARRRCDRCFVFRGSNSHKRRSTSPTKPRGGRTGWNELRGALGRQPRPIQTHHAEVRFSWISVRSSNKTPKSRNATQRAGLRSTIPLGRAEPEFHPARPSWHRTHSPIHGNTRLVESADHLAKKLGSGAASLAKTRPSQRLEQSLKAVLRSPNQVSMSSDNSSFNFHPRHFGDSGITRNGDETTSRMQT